jgi:hypothetical protein
VTKEVTSTLSFSTENVARASGVEASAPILVGPGLAGVIVITPSIPDSPGEGVCPVQMQTAMTMNPKAASKLLDFTAHYIRAPLGWSTIRNTNES